MKKQKLLLSLAMAVLPFVATPAHAVCDGCVVNAVNMAAASISSAVGSSTTAIVASLEQVVNAISGNAATVAAQQAKAAEVIAQGGQRAQSAIEQNRQEDRYQPPDACAVLAPTQGAQDAQRNAISLGGGTGRGGGGRARAPSGGVTKDMQEVLDIAARRTPAQDPLVTASKGVSGACSTFVGSGTRAQACTNAGFVAAVPNGHPDADIRAETLFDGPQRADTADNYRRRLTVDADGQEKQALEAYVRNLNTPVDLQDLGRTALRTNSGRMYLAYRDAYEARMSLAEKPVRDLAANRIANTDLLPVVTQLVKSDVTGAFAKKYLDTNYAKWERRGISIDELMNLEAERRYLNGDWHIKMASLPPEAHTREQSTMMALMVLQLSRINTRLDQMAVLSGQTMATGVRQEMMPQLVNLHSSATGSK